MATSPRLGAPPDPELKLPGRLLVGYTRLGVAGAAATALWPDGAEPAKHPTVWSWQASTRGECRWWTAARLIGVGRMKIAPDRRSTSRGRLISRCTFPASWRRSHLKAEALFAIVKA